MYFMPKRLWVLGFGTAAVIAAMVWFAHSKQVNSNPTLPAKVASLPAYAAVASAEIRKAALERLKAAIPGVEISFDERLGSPNDIHCVGRFLTDAIAANVYPESDPYRAVKAFIDANKDLFGFDASALKDARIQRDSVAAHSGTRSVAWAQTQDGIPVFGAVILANITARGELINIGSQFVPGAAAAAAAGGSPPPEMLGEPVASAELALKSLEFAPPNTRIRALETPDGTSRQFKFNAAGFKGDARAELTWMPVSASALRLSWDFIVTDRASGEMKRIVVDAQTKKKLLEKSLTAYFVKPVRRSMVRSPALGKSSAVPPQVGTPNGVIPRGSTQMSSGIPTVSLRVYTRESPLPMLPGFPTSQIGEPPEVPRSLVTLDAINPSASPAGWIDQHFETRGNNVDAHLDLNDDDIPDLPRAHGTGTNPTVFDFPLDLTQDPSTYRDASMTQLFYLNNFMHDKLYDLGFTESAGNFQSDNFGRGGVGGDAVLADCQDGGGTDNANFATPPDGMAPRMQMYLFDGTTPGRDGSLDATVVLHEYTHGLSNRLVGGGAGISALQPSGMGEGWSDFYALCMCAPPGADPNGAYPEGAYAFGGIVSDNYFRGIRRYPYVREPGPRVTKSSTNPLTFGDIVINNEVHQQGEVWCETLWEARANLFDKYAGTNTDANRLILQIVTDGMKLAPVNPTFLQARDAILMADAVDNGGANQAELMNAFAKRGMGVNALAGSSATTNNVVESFDLAGAVGVSPPGGLTESQRMGAPLTAFSKVYTLANSSAKSVNFSAISSQPWLAVTPPNGTIKADGSMTVSVGFASSATLLPAGENLAEVAFSVSGNAPFAFRDVSYTALTNPRSMSDAFDPDIDMTQWSQITAVANMEFPPTPLAASGNSAWFNGSFNRVAVTNALDTLDGGEIDFSINVGPDVLVDEEIFLEYSVDDQNSYAPLANYDSRNVNGWTRFSIPLPAGAATPATIFRWRQRDFNFGANNWALDNVYIGPKLAIAPVPVVALGSGQSDPVRAPIINFTVQFSADVTGFSGAGVTLGGSAKPASAIVSGSGKNYSVQVAGMTATGTVTITIPTGAAVAIDGTINAASNTAGANYSLPDTLTWTGGSATSDNWSDDANWGGKHLIEFDAIVFDGTQRLTPLNDLSASTQFTSIAFKADGFSVSGSKVVLLAPNAISNLAGSNALGTDVDLTGLASNISIHAASTLAIGGRLESVFPIVLQADGACALNGTFGATNLQKLGAGTLTIRGVDDAATALTIAGGTVRLGVANVFKGGVQVAPGTTLDFSDDTNSYDQELFGIGGSGTITNSGAGAVTLKDSSTQDYTFSGVISGALNYFKASGASADWTGPNSYTGTTTVSAGVLTIDDAGGTGGGTAVTVTGGILTLGDSVSFQKLVTLNGGAISGGDNCVFQMGAAVTGASEILAVSSSMNIGSLSGSGALIKSGFSTATITGASNYSGAIEISIGELVVNSTLSGPITVDAAGTLTAQNGTVGDVTLNGTLNLGSFPGVFNTGSLTCSAFSSMTGVAGFSGASPFSQIEAKGTVALNGCTLSLTPDSSFTPGSALTLIINDSSNPVVGEFAGAPEGAVLPDGTIDSYKGGDGNDVIVFRTSDVQSATTSAGKIVIPSFGSAKPYPATLDISGITGDVTVVTAVLNQVSHRSFKDLAIILVGPKGQSVLLSSNRGGSASDATITFDDNAFDLSNGPVGTGAYKPGGTLITAVPGFPNGADGTQLAAFKHVDPNGTWKLYVYDQVKGAGGKIEGGFSLNITSAPPAFSAFSTDKTTVTLGGTVTLNGTIVATNPNVVHTVRIDWGDGAAADTVTLPAGTVDFTLQHTYAKNPLIASDGVGTLTISGTVFDGVGFGTASVFVTVTSTKPTDLTATLTMASILEGGSTTLSGSLTDVSGVNGHAVRIDWGDGSFSTVLLLPGVSSYSAPHVYADNPKSGNYTIAVTATNDFGDSTSASSEIAVANVAPQIPTISATPAANQDGVATLTAAIVDPGSADTFTFSIDWGDGSAIQTGRLCGGIDGAEHDASVCGNRGESQRRAYDQRDGHRQGRRRCERDNASDARQHRAARGQSSERDAVAGDCRTARDF